MSKNQIFSYAVEQFADAGVDVENALQAMAATPVSMHCWQGDDVTGFESDEKAGAGGGCLATGNYRGKARNVSELMADIDKAASLVPGPLRLNLHANYASDGNPCTGSK